jgi:hypothetical protein
MTKRKIALTAALLVLCVPILGFSQANVQGVPFKDLQNQINNMQQQISSLQSNTKFSEDSGNDRTTRPVDQ